MGLQKKYFEFVEWLIPDFAERTSIEKIRAQLVTAMTLMVIPFHVWPIIKFLALNSPMAYINAAHMMFMIILLAVIRVTGRMKLVGALIMITLFAQQVAASYFTNGLTANGLGFILTTPVGSVLLVSFSAGLFFTVMVIVYLCGLYYLTVIGHIFPNYDIAVLELMQEKHYYAFVIVLAYFLTAMVFQTIKNQSLKTQQEAAEQSRLLADNIRRIIREIGVNSSALASSVEKLSQTSKRMKDSADRISISEVNTSASISQSASTIQEMSTSLRETTMNMKALRKFANAAEDESRFGSEIVNESNEVMSKIEQSSRQVEQITQVISDIAEQTNLLSLNAAIEADKAGEYGKGFAVVAEEVGSLAERSNQAALRINELIQKSESNVKEGKNVINKTGEVLKEIIQHVGNIANQVNDMVVSISQQDIGTREVAKGAEEITIKSDKNVHLVDQLVNLISKSSKSIADLGKITNRLEAQAIDN